MKLLHINFQSNYDSTSTESADNAHHHHKHPAQQRQQRGQRVLLDKLEIGNNKLMVQLSSVAYTRTRFSPIIVS